MNPLDQENLLRAKIPCAETGITVTPGVCGLCGGNCLIDAYQKDGRVLRVEGNRSLPYQTGKICAKGAAACQWVYHPDRLLYPLKRVGKRGEGRFQRIDWAEAIHILAQRLKDCQKKPESTILYTGHPKWYRSELTAFANAYGTPNFGTESSTCFRAMAIGWRASYGKGPFPPDMRHCQTLFVWGVNGAISNTPHAHAYAKVRERGAKIVVIDPRVTPLSRQADLHLRPRPGTDGALALGMAHVLIQENLYDKTFVEKHTTGFTEFSAYIKAFPPARVEELTGVPQDKIVAAARLYGQNKPAAVQLSASPVVHHPNGVQNVRAISLLCALTGNYGIPGGNTPPLQASATLAGHFLAGNHRENAEKDLSHAQYPIWAKLAPDEMQVTALADYLQRRGAYPVENLLAFGMNHRMWPDPDRLECALEAVGFFADVDLFMTETARYADLLLPAVTSFERAQVLTLGSDTVYYQPRLIEPLGEAKNDMEIIQMLSKEMGFQDGVLGYANYEDYLRYQLAPTGLTLEELKAAPQGLKARTLCQPPDETARNTFPTASGKIEFVSSVLTACGMEGLPVFHQTEASREYPLTLSTGCRKPHLFHSRTYRMPWLVGLEPPNAVELHPEDAAALLLTEGSPVWVVTSMGRLPFYAKPDIRCLPGVVNIYHGNGEHDINRLLDPHYLDPISGFPGFKSYVCRIEKREEGDTCILPAEKTPASVV